MPWTSKNPDSQLLGGVSQFPVVVLRIRGEAQLLSPQEPSALTSFTTALQEAQEPFELEVLQRSETQTTPTKVNPALQVGGMTQAPAVSL